MGPVAFALERMLAILEALTLEYVDFPGLDDIYEREDTANLETSRARTLSDVSSALYLFGVVFIKRSSECYFSLRNWFVNDE